jgi:hypothetical protein
MKRLLSIALLAIAAIALAAPAAPATSDPVPGCFPCTTPPSFSR